MEKTDEAIDMYKEILDFDKTKPEIFVYLSIALMKKKDYTEAEKWLNEALEQFADNSDVHFNRAVLFDKMGNFGAMVQSLRKAIELDPDNADALNYLGYSFADRNMNLDESLSLINRALEIRPGNGFIIDSLGWVYFRKGEYKEAIERLIRAVDITQDDPVILEHLGDAYNAAGQPDKAIELWEKAIQFHHKEEGLKQRVEKKLRQLDINSRTE
jgi:tetratricopeptide (TPR) repeat protein